MPDGARWQLRRFLVAALPGTSGAAASAKRRRIVLGRARFSVAPGKERRVRVKFNREARRLFAKKRTRTIVLTIHPKGGTPVSVRRQVTFRQHR